MLLKPEFVKTSRWRETSQSYRQFECTVRSLCCRLGLLYTLLGVSSTTLQLTNMEVEPSLFVEERSLPFRAIGPSTSPSSVAGVESGRPVTGRAGAPDVRPVGTRSAPLAGGGGGNGLRSQLHQAGRKTGRAVSDVGRWGVGRKR